MSAFLPVLALIYVFFNYMFFGITFSVSGNEIKTDEGKDRIIEAIDSDYLFLYTDTSSLPYPVGDGVYARVDIPSGEILCEYRGPILQHDIANTIKNDKKFTIVTMDGGSQEILGTNICSMVNDCAWIIGRIYTVEEINAFKSADNEDCIPTYPGYNYNAVHLKTRTGKIFLYSKKDIKAGEEIFFPYGR